MPSEQSKLYKLKDLQDRIAPAIVVHQRMVASTNDWAKRDVENGTVAAPAVFLADCQSAGRGRGANTWWSAIGNITATIVTSQHPRVAFGLLPLLAGVAVRRALVRVSACDQISLKWPNDLMAGGRKTAGLLCESVRRGVLVGVGVNVNADSSKAPAGLRERITSLAELTGNTWNLTEVVCEIAHELYQVLSVESEHEIESLLKEYSLHHWPTGKHVELVDSDRTARISGRCGGIDPQGRLIVANEQGLHTLLTGSIVSVASWPGTGQTKDSR